MPIFKRMLSNRRFLLLLGCVVALSSYFWLSSRYPSLDAKAIMAGSIQLEDGLSFDVLLTNSEVFPWLHSTLITYINWLYTNKQGMLFGLCFAVVLMSILSLIKPLLLSSNRGGLVPSFLGALLGMPLGVCVNCVSPIAFGLYQKGVRAETVLSTMISSPTLNVVVLSMAFSLFPLHIIGIKFFFTLVCLFFVIPLLVRVFNSEAYAPLNLQAEPESCSVDFADYCTSWKEAVSWCLIELWRNIKYLVIKVVPLMFLAGLLGSIVVSLFPWEELSNYLPMAGTAYTLLAMVLLALFGLFLPVPIAFDIIIAAILLNSGMPVKYVAVLLFVLGSFSIYSYLTLIRAGAKKLATALAISLLTLGILAGATTHYLDKAYQKYAEQEIYDSLLGEDVQRELLQRTPVPIKAIRLPQKLEWIQHAFNPEISYLSLPQSVKKGDGTWKMHKVHNSGLKQHSPPMIYQKTYPYAILTSLTSGDINQDGLVDIIASNTTGIYLYINTGGLFTLANRFPPSLAPVGMVSSILLADIDNNNQPDLLYSTFRDGTYISYNYSGYFSEPKLLRKHESLMVPSIAVADLDHNGELDIALGHHDLKGWKLNTTNASKNRLLLQYNGDFMEVTPDMPPGETLSLLLSDVNHDHYVDWFSAHEFIRPDSIYWGRKDLQWRSANKNEISKITDSTMSFDSADINNDLLLDIYQAQISRDSSTTNQPLVARKSLKKLLGIHCDELMSDTCQQLLFRQANTRFINNCGQLKPELKYDCIASTVALSPKKQRYISNLSKHYSEFVDLHRSLYETQQIEGKKSFLEGNIPTIKGANLLHVQKSPGLFEEQANTMEVATAGWTWNAKFADLDGDSFQDIYAVNGWPSQQYNTENIWFKNIQGEKFSSRGAQVGLNDFKITMAYLYIDYDNDGDLDIVNFSSGGELTLFENSNNFNSHVLIELADYQGNRSGVGSQIIIRYGNKQQQIREIKGSGGYQSNDAPIAHFGLGKDEQILSIEVRWSTGETQIYNGSFPVGRRYKITRSQLPHPQTQGYKARPGALHD